MWQYVDLDSLTLYDPDICSKHSSSGVISYLLLPLAHIHNFVGECRYCPNLRPQILYTNIPYKHRPLVFTIWQSAFLITVQLTTFSSSSAFCNVWLYSLSLVLTRYTLVLTEHFQTLQKLSKDNKATKQMLRPYPCPMLGDSSWEPQNSRMF